MEGSEQMEVVGADVVVKNISHKKIPCNEDGYFLF